MFTSQEVAAMQARGAAARAGTAPPAAAKGRAKVGTGATARRKAWLAAMARGPGVFHEHRLGRGLNGRDHWTVRNIRTAVERGIGCDSAEKLIARDKLALPVTVTLTRYAVRLADDDNIRGILKAVRDGVADAFKTGDGARGGIAWAYRQEVCGRGYFGVRVEICAQ